MLKSSCCKGETRNGEFKLFIVDIFIYFCDLAFNLRSECNFVKFVELIKKCLNLYFTTKNVDYIKLAQEYKFDFY